MIIAIGSDHRGFELKEKIIKEVSVIDWLDCGSRNKERSDFPVFAKVVCDSLFSGDADLGILICGSGIGMAIAANRFKGIYAALCWNKPVAVEAKQDSNSNVLVLPADFIEFEMANEIIEVWINSTFKHEERYRKRLEMVDEF
jgi:ribose 5-phosphate isomerase B